MKEKRQIKQNVIIILLCILLVMIGLCCYLSIRAFERSSSCCELEVSETQTDYVDPTRKEKEEDAYTELMGFGCLEIDERSPFIYLINPADNEVYLSFEVNCENEKLYTSALIAPGKMEEVEVCSRLNAGEHTLTYSITSYDIDDKSILWSGVQQNQDILIRK